MGWKNISHYFIYREIKVFFKPLLSYILQYHTTRLKMKIKFKTLQHKEFTVEDFDENKTIKDLKEAVASKSNNEFPVESQRLIYAGKILTDEACVKDYTIDPEKGFVVVMSCKPKPKPTEKASTESSSSTTSSSAQPAAATTTASTVN